MTWNNSEALIMITMESSQKSFDPFSEVREKSHYHGTTHFVTPHVFELE